MSCRHHTEHEINVKCTHCIKLDLCFLWNISTLVGKPVQNSFQNFKILKCHRLVPLLPHFPLASKSYSAKARDKRAEKCGPSAGGKTPTPPEIVLACEDQEETRAETEDGLWSQERCRRGRTEEKADDRNGTALDSR